MKIVDANVTDFSHEGSQKQEAFGVKIKYEGGSRWLNLLENGEPYSAPTWRIARDKCRSILGLTNK